MTLDELRTCQAHRHSAVAAKTAAVACAPLPGYREGHCGTCGRPLPTDAVSPHWCSMECQQWWHERQAHLPTSRDWRAGTVPNECWDLTTPQASDHRRAS